MTGARIAATVSALFLGLLSGAMLLIAVALVPFWRALPPAAFRAWFEVNAARIGHLMIPLGGGAALASLLALVFGRASPRRTALVSAAAAAVGVGLVTLLVNEPANERFVTPGALDDAATRTLLARWASWHWLRVALGLAGFSAALRALARG